MDRYEDGPCSNTYVRTEGQPKCLSRRQIRKTRVWAHGMEYNALIKNDVHTEMDVHVETYGSSNQYLEKKAAKWNTVL